MSIAINSNFERDQLVASFTGQVNFVYSFPIYSQTYLTVYQRGKNEIPDDATQILTLGVDYTVTGVGAEAGGTIILTVGATMGDIITIVGTQPIQRESLFSDLNPFTVALNQQLNQMTIMMQQNHTYWANLSPHYNFDELVSAPNGADPGVRPYKLILPMLPDGHTWVGRGQLGSIPDDITTEELPTSGSGGGTTKDISQPGQTFVKGNWVRIDVPTGLYVLAQANTKANSERVGVVISSDISNGIFTVQQSGYIDSPAAVFAGLQAGVPQYLSPSVPGAMQNTDVVIEGQASIPCFIPDGPDKGWVIPYRGFIENGAGDIGGSSGITSPFVYLGQLDALSPDGNFTDHTILTRNGTYGSYFFIAAALGSTSVVNASLGLQVYGGGVFETTGYTYYLDGLNSTVPGGAQWFDVQQGQTNLALFPPVGISPVVVSGFGYLHLFATFGVDVEWQGFGGPSAGGGAGYSVKGQMLCGNASIVTGLRLAVSGGGTVGASGYIKIWGIPNS